MTRSADDRFDGKLDVVCELEPPTSGDLGLVREQIALLQRVCDGFLVPDSHLGRATVSSIAVAHEVEYLRARGIACLNARDRNLLGFRRDLLTAAAYGVHELLLVYGDPPSAGERSAMTVSQMLDELSRTGVTDETGQPHEFRVGVAADVREPLADFKHAADFVFTQLSFDADRVAEWAEETSFDGDVYAGVVVLASESMGSRLEDTIPGFVVPDELRERLRGEPGAGLAAAVDQIRQLRKRGVVDGIHLVPVSEYRQLAEALASASL